MTPEGKQHVRALRLAYHSRLPLLILPYHLLHLLCVGLRKGERYAISSSDQFLLVG